MSSIEWNHYLNRIPDAQSGDWRIETKETTGWGQARGRAVAPGIYRQLFYKNVLYMSTVPCEYFDHYDFMEVVLESGGSVLVMGLGLGAMLEELLFEDSEHRITDITVIEKSPDVIKLVAPAFADVPLLTIIEADALTWEPPEGKRYTTVWHDIWPHITPENLPDMKMLMARYEGRCDYQECWAYSEILQEVDEQSARNERLKKWDIRMCVAGEYIDMCQEVF